MAGENGKYLRTFETTALIALAGKLIADQIPSAIIFTRFQPAFLKVEKNPLTTPITASKAPTTIPPSPYKIPGNTDSVVSSYTITCPDPRKYSRQFETNGEIFEYIPYDSVPDSISFTASKDNSVKVTNGRQIISISNAALKKGDRVEMLIREGKILINGENKTRVLDLTSPFKSFTVRTGEVIKSDNGTPLIKYRGVWL